MILASSPPSSIATSTADEFSLMAFLHAITSWTKGIFKWFDNDIAPLPVNTRVNLLFLNLSVTLSSNSDKVFFVSE